MWNRPRPSVMLPRVLRPGPKVLVPLALSVLAAQAWCQFALSGPSLAIQYGAGDLFPVLLTVALTTLVGRLALAWLPAGRPGGHAVGELPATLATSFVLGEILLYLQQRVMESFGGDLGSLGLSWTGPWIALAVLRLATLPGALVPGHRLAHQRSGDLARFLFVAAAGLLIFLTAAAYARAPVTACFGLSTGLWVLGVDSLAGAVLLVHALRDARRAPLGRALCLWLLVLSVPYGMGLSGSAALGLGFLVPWLRRAERRAAWLSALGFLGVTVSGAPLAGLAGLVLLVAAGRPQQGRDAFLAVLLPAAYSVAALIGFEESWEPHVRGALLSLWFVLIGLVAFTVLWLPFALLLDRTAQRPSIAEPVRESVALAAFVLAAAWNVGYGLPVGLTVALPAGVLFSGLVWVPTERAYGVSHFPPRSGRGGK